VPVVSPERARFMEARLARELKERGVQPADVLELTRLHARVMTPFHDAFSDDHHPVYLHPARSALVMLIETPERDVAALALALVVDSERILNTGTVSAPVIPNHAAEALRDSPAVWSDEVLKIGSRLDAPGSPTRLESLVVESDPFRAALLAERLDHLRHLHLWRGSEAVARAADEVQAVDLPAAGRAHPRLAQLLRGWLRRSERYHLKARAVERAITE